jgi:hypothetical protein
MTERLRRRLLLVAVSLPLLCSIISLASAAEQGQRRVVNGVVIYLGVVPAEILQQELADHADARMHDGVPPGGHVYHVMVALFEQATGRRIGNAEVALSVSELFEPGAHLKLEPMAIGGTLAYGNYVDLPGTGPYRLTVFVRLQGMPDTIEAEFNYQHARV